MNRIKIELPFSGFYESIHDSRLDDEIEQHFNYNHSTGEDREITEEEAEAISFADIDWHAIRSEYAHEYVNCFAHEFNLDIEYEELISPREYNFSTDRIFATIAPADMQRIRKEVESDKDWKEVVKQRFTSYDGFYSFYKPDTAHEQWTRPVLDECQYEVMLQHWLNMKHRDDPLNNPEWNEREYHICDDIEISNFESIAEAIEQIEKYIKANKAVK